MTIHCEVNMSIKEEVENWLDNWSEDDQKVALEDLQKGGCISGMVGPLCYYDDTVEFFERNKEEINLLLANLEEISGEPALHTLANYDSEDPLCLEQQNQNLLAWFGFEIIADQVYSERYEN